MTAHYGICPMNTAEYVDDDDMAEEVTGVEAELACLRDDTLEYQKALYAALKAAGFPPILLWAGHIVLSHDGRTAIVNSAVGEEQS